MKIKRRLLCFLLSFLLTVPLSGGSAPRPAPYSLVARIEVLSRYHGQNYLRTYSNPEKTEVILDYLRFLRFRGKLCGEPADLGGDLYEMRIVYSDGSVKLYRQREYSFQDKGNRCWQRIDKKQAQLLYPLLLLLPEDEEDKAGYCRASVPTVSRLGLSYSVTALHCVMVFMNSSTSVRACSAVTS